MTHVYSKNWFIAITVAIGGFVFGFDASVISGVSGFVTQEFQLNEWETGFIVSAPTLGATIAMLFAGAAADAIGRKKVLIIISALYVISAVFSAFALNYATLVTARIIGGFAFASLIIAPMYIAEISPAVIRGKMISVNQFNIVIGFAISYFTNYYLLQLSGGTEGLAVTLGITENVWRWMLGLEIIPALLYFILLFTIPESPRWLVCNNQEEKARPILLKLFPEDDCDNLISDIKADSREVVPPLFERLVELCSNKMRFIIAIGLILAVFQQITGINSVFFYAPTIFEQSGVGKDAAFSQAIWVGLTNVIFTIIAMLLIDKLGRKPLLIIGFIGIFISMSIISYGFHKATYQLNTNSVSIIKDQDVLNNIQPLIGQVYKSDIDFKQAIKETLGEDVARNNQAKLLQASANMDSKLILVGILAFIASFAISLGPVMWVLLAEIFPNHLRGIGIACCGVINSLMSFSVQFVFPWQLSNLGNSLTFLLYGLSALIGLGLIYSLLPETKGKSLEEIAHDFQRS